jgi:hypothetical protein
VERAAGFSIEATVQRLTGERPHVTDLRSRWMKCSMLRAETYVGVALEAR